MVTTTQLDFAEKNVDDGEGKLFTYLDFVLGVRLQPRHVESGHLRQHCPVSTHSYDYPQEDDKLSLTTMTNNDNDDKR